MAGLGVPPTRPQVPLPSHPAPRTVPLLGGAGEAGSPREGRRTLALDTGQPWPL